MSSKALKFTAHLWNRPSSNPAGLLGYHGYHEGPAERMEEERVLAGGVVGSCSDWVPAVSFTSSPQLGFSAVLLLSESTLGDCTKRAGGRADTELLCFSLTFPAPVPAALDPGLQCPPLHSPTHTHTHTPPTTSSTVQNRLLSLKGFLLLLFPLLLLYCPPLHLPPHPSLPPSSPFLLPSSSSFASPSPSPPTLPPLPPPPPPSYSPLLIPYLSPSLSSSFPSSPSPLHPL